MKKMSCLTLVFAVLFSCVVAADDNPQDVKGSQKLSKMECIDNSTQTCINDACLTSESTDCQEHCRKMAKDKCQEESNE